MSEWEQTCSREAVAALLPIWEAWGGIVYVNQIASLPVGATKCLRRLGFTGTVDKFILRLALALRDHNVVTEDCDFWDPRDVRGKGNRRAPVAHYCRTELGVSVWLLGRFIAQMTTPRRR